MATSVSLVELRSARIHLTADEVVAIAQQLIHHTRAVHAPIETVPLAGPPTADNVYLSRDGSVCCRGYDATPAVFEIAILLQSILPQGTTAPGALRYTIARALLEVDVPPFDSLHEFSEALSRFERVDRGDLIRGVVDRWQESVRAASLAFPAALDRRRSSALASDLRRHLREADARLYEQSLAIAPAIENRVAAPVKRFRFLPAFGACFAAGGMLIAAGEFMQLQPDVDVTLPSVAPPARLSGDSVAPSGVQLPKLPAVASQSPARRDAVRRPAKLLRPANVRNDRADATKRERRGPSRSVLEKLRLQWLKNAFSLHPDRL
jgi:hypothetical protein